MPKVSQSGRIHLHDCLRANKSLACHGIECRVPFLDRNVVNYAMRYLDPSEDDYSTKEILRKDFHLFLPEFVIRRRKEQFSDGVGNEWIDGLKKHSEMVYPDISDAEKRYPYQTPQTAEAYLYRTIFQELFGNESEETVFYSMRLAPVPRKGEDNGMMVLPTIHRRNN